MGKNVKARTRKAAYGSQEEVAVALPRGYSPLGSALGKRLKYIREARGLSTTQAAEQVGISQPHWVHLERGAIIPARWLAERLCLWAYEGKTFKRAKRPAERREVVRSEGWKSFKAALPPEYRIRLLREASRLKMAPEELIQLAVERFLDNGPVLCTMERAVAQYERTKVASYLLQVPYLQTFLEGDIELAVRMGATLVEHEPRNIVEELVNAHDSELILTPVAELEGRKWDEL